MYLYEFANELPIRTHSGLEVATNYSRIVYGGRGAYVEFSFDQVVKTAIFESLTPHYYYREFFTRDSTHAKVYYQRHRVNYADYIPNMFYISPIFLLNFKRTQNKYRVVEV